MNHALKSRCQYPYQPMIFIINIININRNISPIINIGPDINSHYRVNIMSGTSKPDTLLPIYIGIGQYLKS